MFLLDAQAQLHERLYVYARMKFHVLELGQNRNDFSGRSGLARLGGTCACALSPASCSCSCSCFAARAASVFLMFLLYDLLIVRNVSWI